MNPCICASVAKHTQVLGAETVRGGSGAELFFVAKLRSISDLVGGSFRSSVAEPLIVLWTCRSESFYGAVSDGR